MTTRQQRRAAARKATNGQLSPEHKERLRQILQPLVMQYRLSVAALQGYLEGAGLPNAKANIDISTGEVTLEEKQG